MANGHGGARPNSGGKRPGAGRPKGRLNSKTIQQNETAKTLPSTGTPLEWLDAVVQHPDLDLRLRIAAATAMLPYCHIKKGDGGIKDEKAEKAKKVSTGKFAASAAPFTVVK